MIRPAYPDELPRIRSILQGAPFPGDARFVIYVREEPVERILAVAPWWKVAVPDDKPELAGRAVFHLQMAGAFEIPDELFDEMLDRLESDAREDGVRKIGIQTPVPEESWLFQRLSARGYGIGQTDRHFLTPGDRFKERATRIHNRIRDRIPSTWRVESIKGHDPEKIFAAVAEHGLMPPHQFQYYWNAASPEHFEDEVSCVLIDDDRIVGTFLLTRRGEDELHVHVESVTADHLRFSAIASAAMRHHMASHCAPGHPKEFSWRADSVKHPHTSNTALRQGGRELPPRHSLRKEL